MNGPVMGIALLPDLVDTRAAPPAHGGLAIHRVSWLPWSCLAVFVMVCGCGDSDGPRLAEAGGAVTYKGQPVATATVMFLPEVGAPAMAETDDKGRFSFNTQGKPGAIIGPGRVSISAVRQLREVTDEEMEKIGGAALDSLLASIRKSVIPEKYNHPDTSGLTITVTEDADKNQFNFDLK
jgi:hypothetical protein